MSAIAGVWGRDYAQQDDAALLGRIRAGDSEAYAELWRRHLPAAYAVAHRHRGRTSADDIVGEASLRVYDLICAGKGPTDNFRAYFLAAVRSAAVDAARTELRVVPSGPDALESVAGAVLAHDIEGRVDQELARAAFGRLSEREQQVLWHTAVEGRAPAVAARVLGMTPNGVSVAASRARETLRARYLDAHADRGVNRAKDDECRWVLSSMGRYVRGKLPSRQRSKVQQHLSGCRHAQVLMLEMSEVNRALSALVVPLVLVSASSAGLAWAGTWSGLGALHDGAAGGQPWFGDGGLSGSGTPEALGSAVSGSASAGSTSGGAAAAGSIGAAPAGAVHGAAETVGAAGAAAGTTGAAGVVAGSAGVAGVAAGTTGTAGAVAGGAGAAGAVAGSAGVVAGGAGAAGAVAGAAGTASAVVGTSAAATITAKVASLAAVGALASPFVGVPVGSIGIPSQSGGEVVAAGKAPADDGTGTRQAPGSGGGGLSGGGSGSGAMPAAPVVPVAPGSLQVAPPAAAAPQQQTVKDPSLSNTAPSGGGSVGAGTAGSTPGGAAGGAAVPAPVPPAPATPLSPKPVSPKAVTKPNSVTEPKLASGATTGDAKAGVEVGSASDPTPAASPSPSPVVEAPRAASSNPPSTTTPPWAFSTKTPDSRTDRDRQSDENRKVRPSRIKKKCALNWQPVATLVGPNKKQPLYVCVRVADVK